MVAASIAVRHMGPGVPDGDVVISASRGAYQSTALLAPDPPEHGPRRPLRDGDRLGRPVGVAGA